VILNRESLTRYPVSKTDQEAQRGSRQPCAAELR
jgi:hypothetical protein